MTSPVKLVGKIRYRARFQASSGHSDSANRPGYEAVPAPVEIEVRPLSFQNEQALGIKDYYNSSYIYRFISLRFFLKETTT